VSVCKLVAKKGKEKNCGKAGPMSYSPNPHYGGNTLSFTNLTRSRQTIMSGKMEKAFAHQS